MTNVSASQFGLHEYWHLTHNPGQLLWNVRLAKGQVACSDLYLPGSGTPYGFLRGTEEKERLFENVRLETDCSMPTRVHALFLFDDRAAAELAQREWFSAESRALIRVWLQPNANIHRADARLLDGLQPTWRENARRYWRAELTDNARVEIVFRGVGYCPDWQDEPFGRLI